MAFLAAGTQQGHREDVPSCAVTTTDSYSTVYTVGPLSFSLYLERISSILNLSTFICCCLAHFHKKTPCKPLKWIHPAQIFTADLTPRSSPAPHTVPQPDPLRVCSHHTALLCCHSHTSYFLGMKHPYCSFFSEKELLIASAAALMLLSAEGSCYWRQPRAACAVGWFLTGWLPLKSPATTEVTHTSLLRPCCRAAIRDNLGICASLL